MPPLDIALAKSLTGVTLPDADIQAMIDTAKEMITKRFAAFPHIPIELIDNATLYQFFILLLTRYRFDGTFEIQTLEYTQRTDVTRAIQEYEDILDTIEEELQRDVRAFVRMTSKVHP